MLDNRESATGVSLGILIAHNSFHQSYRPHLEVCEIFPKEEGQN